MCFSSSSGNSQSFDVVKLWFFHIVYRLMWWNSISGLLLMYKL
jgi:hypothetical protein